MNIIKYMILTSMIFAGFNSYCMDKAKKSSSSSSSDEILSLSQERSLKTIQDELWQKYKDKVEEEALKIAEMSPRQRFLSDSYSTEKYLELKKNIKRKSREMFKQQEKVIN